MLLDVTSLRKMCVCVCLCVCKSVHVCMCLCVCTGARLRLILLSIVISSRAERGLLSLSPSTSLTLIKLQAADYISHANSEEGKIKKVVKCSLAPHVHPHKSRKGEIQGLE